MYWIGIYRKCMTLLINPSINGKNDKKSALLIIKITIYIVYNIIKFKIENNCFLIIELKY